MNTASKFDDIRVALAGMLALAVAMGIGRFAFTPILPMMQGDAGVTVVVGGWLATANYVGYLFGALVAMVQPLQAGRALIAGLQTITLATIAMSFTENVFVWGALRFAAGVASALVFIAVSACCLEKSSPDGRSVRNGFVFSGVGAGIVLAGLLCLGLMAMGASSAAAWTVTGIAAFAASIPVIGAFYKSRLFQQNIRGTLAWQVEHREQLRLVLCYGVAGFGYIVPATFLPAMAKDAIDDPAFFGWAWPVFGAAALVSTLISAKRPRSIRNRSVWIASQLLMASGIVLPVFIPGLVSIVIAGLMVGGTFMVITMAGIQEAREAKGDAPRLIAAMTAAFALGQILGPVVTSSMLDAGVGFHGGLLLASGLLSLSAGALWRRSTHFTDIAVHGKDGR